MIFSLPIEIRHLLPFRHLNRVLEVNGTLFLRYGVHVGRRNLAGERLLFRWDVRDREVVP